MNSRDFPLPISGEGQASPSPWAVEQEPSTFIVLWPGQSQPTMTEVVSALSHRCETPLAKMRDMPPRDGTLWAAAFATSLAEAPLIIWAEPAAPLAEGELDDPRARACRWIVGLQTMLSKDQSYEEYVAVLTAMAAALEPVAVLDAVTGCWMEQDGLQDLAHEPPGVPPVESMWVIHAVREPQRPELGCWLHTHGLWRCGRPELEMLEVPPEKSAIAGRLLNDIARLVLDESELPVAPEPLAIGPNMNVTLHPWQEIVSHLNASSHGSINDRDDEDGSHVGTRAVVCGPQPHETTDAKWAWPAEAIEMLESDRGLIFRSSRDTQRAALLARERWDELAVAFASIQNVGHSGDDQHSIRFSVKARFAAPDDPEVGEHMWVDVNDMQKETAQGELMNQPLRVAHLSLGQVVSIERSCVSDWRVHTAAGSFAPSDVPAMWRALDVLRSGGQPSLKRKSNHGLPREAAEEPTRP